MPETGKKTLPAPKPRNVLGGLTAYLAAMGKFHNYSLGNILEIAGQKPDATRVAGPYAWNQLGRKAMKGPKGICILALMIGVRRKKNNEAKASADPAAINAPHAGRLSSGSVFDASQIESSELVDLKERVKAEAGVYRERLINFIIAQTPHSNSRRASHPRWA